MATDVREKTQGQKHKNLTSPTSGGGVPKRVRAGENPRTETKQQQEPSLLRAKGRGERGATS